MDVEDEAHLDLLAALLIAFAALGCLVALLFVIVEGVEQPLTPLSHTASEAQALSSSGDDLPNFLLSSLAAANSSGATVGVLDQDMDNNGNLDGLADPLAAASKSEVTVSVLDQDLDNDGNPDGLADPLVVVEMLLALTLLVSGSFLLALYNLPKPSFFCQLVLERPG